MADILLNRAALTNASAPLWEVSAAEFAVMIEVNVKGTSNMVRNFMRAKIEQGSVVTINFSSGWGRVSAPDIPPYCVSKRAVEGLTPSLAQELPKGMAAIPLNPEMINTYVLRRLFGETAGEYESATAWAECALPFLQTEVFPCLGCAWWIPWVRRKCPASPKARLPS
jgi:NAD(P)-dependent dehydrogenase (short-subunit alcohol dehydrogenase family)